VAPATETSIEPGRRRGRRKIATDERFVICYNPEQAARDAALREAMTGP